MGGVGGNFNFSGNLVKTTQSTSSSRGSHSSMKSGWPFIETAEDLYQHYKNKDLTEDIIYELNKDFKRTDPSMKQWKLDYLSGKNSLYNVMKAFINCVPEEKSSIYS
jgi:hypothetical protein